MPLTLALLELPYKRGRGPVVFTSLHPLQSTIECLPNLRTTPKLNQAATRSIQVVLVRPASHVRFYSHFDDIETDLESSGKSEKEEARRKHDNNGNKDANDDENPRTRSRSGSTTRAPTVSGTLRMPSRLRRMWAPA